MYGSLKLARHPAQVIDCDLDGLCMRGLYSYGLLGILLCGYGRAGTQHDRLGECQRTATGIVMALYSYGSLLGAARA